MANIRELQARFVAQASGFKSTIQGMKRDVDSLAKETKRSASAMGESFQKGAQGLQTNMNKAAGSMKGFGSSLGEASRKVSDVGWGLTKKITAPATIATAAIGGLVAKMGWDRLKSIDEAKAQLEGLGYSGKEIESIMATTEKAIEGGLTTMGEGISIAAGGLAAGVKEGKDLEKYIKLVGDAAVGANRPVDEMAQIFNRVVGGGKLMTEELNMIEHGMPGFSKAMAKHLGVPQTEFRKMVTAGEVGSDDFLEVMDDFAGGMAEAYSHTWSGMVDNTKAYIAILGQHLMGGVFEKSKESIAEFIKLLQSDEVVEGAKKMGEGLGNAFGKMIQIIQSLLKWFVNLSTTSKKVIGAMAGIAVGAGPLLLAVAGIGRVVAFVSTGLGSLIGFLAKTITPIKSLASSTGLAGRAFGLLSGTAGIVIGWITAFVAIIVTAYKKSEPFRNSIANLGESFKGLWNRLKEVISPIGVVKDEFGFLKDVAMFLYGGLKDLADIIFKVIGSAFAFLVNEISFAIDIFVAMLSGIENFTEGFKRLFSGDIRGAIDSFVTGVKTMASNVGDVFSDMLANVWNYIKEVTPKWVKSFLSATGDILKNIGIFAMELPGKVGKGISDATKHIVENIPTWLLSFTRGLDDIIMKVASWSVDLVKKMGKGLADVTVHVVKNIPKWTVAFVNGLGDILASVGSWSLDLVSKFAIGLAKVTVGIGAKIGEWTVTFVKGLGNILLKVGEWAIQLPGKVIGAISNTTTKVTSGIGEWISSFVSGLGDILKSIGTWALKVPGKVASGISNALPQISTKLGEWKDKFVEKTKEIATLVFDWATQLPSKIKSGLTNAKDAFGEWFNTQKEKIKTKTTEIKDEVLQFAKDIPKMVVEGLGSGTGVFSKWLNEQHEENKEFYGGLAGKAGKWLGEKVGEITGGLAKWGVAFTTFFAELPGKIGTKAKEMWTNFKEGFLDKTEAITEKLGEWNASIVTWFKEMPGKIKEKATNMWTNFKEGFLDRKEGITEGFNGWKESIFEWFSNTGTNIKEWAGDFGENFKTGIVNVKDKVIEAFSGWWTGIKEFFSGLGKKKEVKDSGKDMIKSVGDGFKDNKEDLMSKIGKIVLAIPAVIIAVGAVILLSAGRELIKYMAKGISGAAGLVSKGIKGIWNGMKSVFTWGINLVIGLFTTGFIGKIITSITGFASKVVNKIKSMWTTVKNLFKTSISNVYNFVKDSFVGRIIKSIANFIKNFKSKISGMWSSVKKTFSTMINSVYNYVKNSFVGKIIKSISGFVKNLKNKISNLWKSISDKFTSSINTVYNKIRNSFVGRIIKSIVGFIKNFKTKIKVLWVNLVSNFLRGINKIYDKIKNSFVGRIISSIAGFIKNFKGKISGMWKSVKNTFSSFIGSIKKSIANSFVGSMLKSVKSLKTKFVNIAKDMWSGVKKQFGKIVSGAKALPGKIGSGISKAKDKAISGMKTVGQGILKAFQKPIDGVKSGVNWVLGKFGVDKIKGSWKLPGYAKGTGGHPEDGPALVGDGTGRWRGQELITAPNGQAMLSPDVPTMMNLPKGTSVMSAIDTKAYLENIPQYSKGTDKADKLREAYSPEAKKKRTAHTEKRMKKSKKEAGKLVSDVWDYAKKPGKLLNLALKAVGISSPGGPGWGIKIAKGGFKKAKEGAVTKIKDTFKKEEESGFHMGSGKVSGSVKSWIAKAIKSTGVPSSWAGALQTIAMKESGGRTGPSTINKWDSNWKAGIPSMGLMQTIGPTFSAYKKQGMNDIMNPVHNAASAIGYIKSRYGNPFNTPGIKSMKRGGPYLGYEDGGIVNQKQLAWIAEGGWAESVISHDPAKHSAQKNIWEKTGSALGFNSDENQIKLLERITDHLEKEKDVDLLQRIAKGIEKGHVIEMDNEKVAEAIYEPFKNKDAKFSVGRYF